MGNWRRALFLFLLLLFVEHKFGQSFKWSFCSCSSYIDCAAFEHCSIYMLIVVIRRNEWIECEANTFEISELEDDGSSLRSVFSFYFTGEFTIDVHHWWIMQSTTCSYMNLMSLNWSTHFMWVHACFHILNGHLICKKMSTYLGIFFPLIIDYNLFAFYLAFKSHFLMHYIFFVALNFFFVIFNFCCCFFA